MVVMTSQRGVWGPPSFGKSGQTKSRDRFVFFRWEKLRNNVNRNSGMVNIDSGKCGKMFTLKPESVFTFDRNICSG
jgi:hypothetical protein